ncbi:MAG: class I SAM-dependent methyltransferase [Acutalibacteraceae bacterium]
MTVKLTPRLSAAASLVKGGGIVADIGTDHGYLPVFLIQQNKISGAIGADIKKGPLENAAKTVSRYGLSDKISVRLSDGLNEFKENEADEIVFAGMGGTLIAEKLKETPWIKNPKIHFVFQPQSRAEDLREFLYSNGFEIGEEIAVKEDERYYIAFDAFYTGVKREFTPADCFMGKLPKTEEAKMHIQKQLNRLQKKYNATEEIGKKDQELFEIIEKLNEFLNS